VAVSDELVRAETVGGKAFLCRLGVLARHIVREVVPNVQPYSRAQRSAAQHSTAGGGAGQSRAAQVRWRSGAGGGAEQVMWVTRRPFDRRIAAI
jgi:hypothetical protein